MMRLFFKYLKQKRRSVIACGVFALIFAVSFFLYCLPVEAVIYPALLCAVIGLFLLVFDYLRVKRKHEALTKIKTITDAMTASFPAIDGIQDADYHGSGPHGVRVSDGAEASGAFQSAECMLSVLVTGIAIVFFGVFYGAVYKITSNAYYAIVSAKQQNG